MAETRARRPRAEGIVSRHTRACRSSAGGACDCEPRYQAQVYSARDRRTIRKTFSTVTEARAWRAEAHVALRGGIMRASTRTTLAEAGADWVAAAKTGVVRTRSGEVYKPSALRGYEEALRTKVLPELGHLRLSAVTRNTVQNLVDRLVAEGRAPSTVRNAVLPLRAIYGRATNRAEVAVNPTLGLLLPALRTTRDRVAPPAEANALIAALPVADRALWATALYSGLRRGELQALDWRDVDLNGRLLCVERSWDPIAGPIGPKSRSGRRRVPVTEGLRTELLAHRLRQGRGGLGFVFGAVPGRPFDAPAALQRARAAWRRAGLEPVGLHECRHTYATFMIAAGVNVKALSAYMGHSTITVTLDRYGHLLPGSEGEAAALLEIWLKHRGGTDTKVTKA